MNSTPQEESAREHKERAAALLAKGKLEGALHEYERSIQLAPKDVVARRKVAELLARLGRNGDAVTAYQQLVGRFAAEGRLVEAIALCKVILQLEPKHRETQATLAKLYAKRDGVSSMLERLPHSMSGAIDMSNTRAARHFPKPRLALPGSPESEEENANSDVDIVVSELPQTPLFSELPEAVMQALLERLTMIPYLPGEAILTEGETGRSLFVLASGTVEVVRNDAAGKRQVLDTMEAGAFFGEIGLVADIPRLATVVAIEDCMVLEVTRELIAQLSQEFPFLEELVRGFYKVRLLSNLIRSSPIFVPLSEAERKAVVEKFGIRYAQPGEALLTQGEAERGLFLLLRGRCSVSYRDVAGEETMLPEMTEGAVMGEISLINGTAVTATVTAVTPVVLLFLEASAFVEHLLSNPKSRALITKLSEERLKRTEALEQRNIERAFL